MAEETTTVEETNESPTPETVETQETPVSNTINVGGKEYTPEELAETAKNYEELRQYTDHLEGFKEATSRLMNPNTDSEVKKHNARQILLDMNYDPDQVEEWVQVYDQGNEMPEKNEQVPERQNFEDPRTDQLNDQVLKMRAQMLQQNLENSLSSAISSDNDGKVLMDWLGANRSEEEANAARKSVSERVRAQALENLRNRRNQAGLFEDSWVGEEVKKAANSVAKDMLTVIGDPSKIGRVPETAGQNETLHRKEPVKVPDTKGKSFGDVEAQLRDWTSDQLLRSLSDPGGESKA